MSNAAEQRIALGSSAVETSETGARRLGEEYWAEISRVTRGLVRARAGRDGVELTLVGRFTLFGFGPSEPTVDDERTSCRFEILRGLLVARAGGSLTITQNTRPPRELIVAVDGYIPRLDPTRDRSGAGGFLYTQLQERAHNAVGRRYLERMARAH